LEPMPMISETQARTDRQVAGPHRHRLVHSSRDRATSSSRGSNCAFRSIVIA